MIVFSRHIYSTILLHIVLILATSGAGLWLILSHGGIIIGILLMLCALFQIEGLVQKLNTVNRKIRLFFNAVQDKDTMLYYPEQGTGREQMLLNKSLNRINRILAQAQEAHKKQEHLYQTLLEKVPSGIIAWNSSGKVITANSAAHHLLQCHHLTDEQQVRQLLDEQKQLSVSQSKMKLQCETLTILSVKDITKELNDKESDSWNELTHVLTHEIMNTIAPIISLSQTLSTYPDIPSKAVRGLRIIRTQSERLMEFTESFRQLSYMRPPQIGRFSLTELFSNLKELLETDFRENQICFNLRCLPGNIEIDGDSNQLSQVLLNLLRNAMQAVEGVENAEISLLAEFTDSLQIDVADNGVGIPSEIREKVFVPFFTTKPEGSGIGLCLCRQIVRQHKGHLFILESRPGQTCFRMILPR